MTIAVGTMTWGREADEAEARRMYGLARERGVVWFDTASSYSGGATECILGRCLRDDHRRDEVRISTKGGYNGEPIGQEAVASMGRLGAGRISLYLHHHWMRHGSPRAAHILQDLVHAQVANSIGLSNCAAWQVAMALDYAKLSAIQVQYSLLKRQAEVELIPLAAAKGLRVFAYSPLAAGILTGKYLLSGLGRCDSRRLDSDERYRKRFAGGGCPWSYLEAAESFNMTPAQLAVAWVGSHPSRLVAPIVGARNTKQLSELLDAQPLSSRAYVLVSDLFPAPPPATDRPDDYDESVKPKPVAPEGGPQQRSKPRYYFFL